MAIERRKLRRQFFQLAVRVRLDSIDELITEVAREISLGGMSLRLNQQVYLGEKIYLEFRLREGDPLISVFATVKWCKPYGNSSIAGVEFLDLDEQGRQFLKQVLVYIQEHRMYQRIDGKYSVQIHNKSIEHFANAYADDISSGGMRLNVNQALKPGEVLQLSFQLQNQRELLRVQGLVRWCEPRPHGFAVGLEFQQLDPKAKQFLEDVIRFGPKKN